MSEKGKIIIRKNKKGKWVFEVDIGKKKPMRIPAFYDLKDDSLNGKNCEVERENGQIKRILVDGKELPKRQQQKAEYHSFPSKSSYTRNQRRSFMQSIYSIYSIQNTKLPSDTKGVLGENDIDNFSLKLNKCVNFIFNNEKHKEEAILYKSKYKDKNDNRLKKFEIEFNFESLKDIIYELKNRQDKIQRELKQQGYKIKIIELRPDWRMVVGLGNESVYETSMTLHHIYGIPYIPGSAIKGVVRNYIITEQFEQNEEEALLRDKGFCLIFGSPKNSSIGEYKGNVIFFDAYPLEPPDIEPDVMNVHYPDYYGGDKPPADYQNPNPIFFLTVRDTHFKFMMGIKNNEDKEIGESKLTENIDELSENSTLLETAFYWLKRALSVHGIGAKTAVGYGYMNT